MTANADAVTRETVAARARGNREHVRRLLKVRQPQFAAALELAAQDLMRDLGTLCESPAESPEGVHDGASHDLRDSALLRVQVTRRFLALSTSILFASPTRWSLIIRAM